MQQSWKGRCSSDGIKYIFGMSMRALFRTRDMLSHSSLTFLLFGEVRKCDTDFLLGIVKGLLKSYFKKDSSAQSAINVTD